jgi:phosphoribosyl-AMP cyclohydrolase
MPTPTRSLWRGILAAALLAVLLAFPALADDFGGGSSSIPTFKAATADTAGTRGLVPAPAAGAQAKFLRADSSWQTVDVSGPIGTHADLTTGIHGVGSAKVAAVYHPYNSTADATPVELFLNGTSTRIQIPAATTYRFRVLVSAYNSTDGLGAGFEVRGTIRRNAADGTALVNSSINEYWTEGAMSGCACAVTADDTNDALAITVTGLADKAIAWKSNVEVTP